MIRIFVSGLIALTISSAAVAAEGASSARPAVDPDSPPCSMVKAGELQKFVGAPATIRETSARLCSWAGATEGAYVQVMLFPGESLGVPAGQERAYFDQTMGGEQDQYGSETFAEVPDVGEKAWGLKLADNPQKYYKVYAFKGKDSLTIATNGIGYDATVEIARIAVSRM
ncbi:hypothetical protein [Rhizobium sp. 21-4511-3d]